MYDTSWVTRVIQLTFPSANADMTFPKADRDWFIFFASFKVVPSAPVLLTFKRNSTQN